MVTVNKALQALSVDDVNVLSDRFLRGWRELSKFGFRLAGFNHKRMSLGLDALTYAESDKYRIDYIQANYSYDQIYSTISDYLSAHRVDKCRYTGIELFDCYFGAEYARLFKRLLGSKAYRYLSEQTRCAKLMQTQIDLYGGVGLASEKAIDSYRNTCLNKYGVNNVMQSKQVLNKLVSPFANSDVREKSLQSRIVNSRIALNESDTHNGLLLQSPHERIVFALLVERFGYSDVIYQYGRYPFDARYPFSCDFYLKNEDIFIELNGHYSHGNHWYDATNTADVMRRIQLQSSQSKHSRSAVKTWCDIDVIKRNKAKSSGIKYLVFWNGNNHFVNKHRIPRLRDFYMWFYDYDCDYESFIRDHSENTC